MLYHYLAVGEISSKGKKHLSIMKTGLNKLLKKKKKLVWPKLVVVFDMTMKTQLKTKDDVRVTSSNQDEWHHTPLCT